MAGAGRITPARIDVGRRPKPATDGRFCFDLITGLGRIDFRPKCLHSKGVWHWVENQCSGKRPIETRLLVAGFNAPPDTARPDGLVGQRQFMCLSSCITGFGRMT